MWILDRNYILKIYGFLRLDKKGRKEIRYLDEGVIFYNKKVYKYELFL